MSVAAREIATPTELSVLLPHGSATNQAAASSLCRSLLVGSVAVVLVTLAAGFAISRNWMSLSEDKRSADLYLVGASHPWPCNEIMVGVWTKTCLVQTQGMISYNLVSLRDGSFAEVQSDGLGFMSMYGTYTYTPGEVASSSQNCLVEYTARFKQEPLDRWRPAQGSLDYNTWYFGKDYFTNEPNSVSCRFERIKGQECRNRISRLLFHFANDGVSLSQYQTAPDELC